MTEDWQTLHQMNEWDECHKTHLALILVVHAVRSVALLQLLSNVAGGVELQRKRDGSLLTCKGDTSNVVSNLERTRETTPRSYSR
jgi:hypothetical protein